jgi:hypothetical protein
MEFPNFQVTKGAPVWLWLERAIKSAGLGRLEFAALWVKIRLARTFLQRILEDVAPNHLGHLAVYF